MSKPFTYMTLNQTAQCICLSPEEQSCMRESTPPLWLYNKCGCTLHSSVSCLCTKLSQAYLEANSLDKTYLKNPVSSFQSSYFGSCTPLLKLQNEYPRFVSLAEDMLRMVHSSHDTNSKQFILSMNFHYLCTSAPHNALQHITQDHHKSKL